MGFRIVYIEEATSLKLYLDNIKIIKESGTYTIPLSDINTLVVDNEQISITIPLMNKCSEYNINLILCSVEHMPQTVINPYSGNYRYPQMLKKQIAWQDSMKLILHDKIVKNKIMNQVDLLKHLDKSLEVCQMMLRYHSEVSNGDAYNREGLAAKVYFRELFGRDFKRFNEDVENYALNYGYSILRSQISKTLIAKGLTPCLGIFHIGFDNPFNLSDDIIEVFRPLIDFYVYQEVKDSVIFKREHRLGLIKTTGNDAYIKGKRQSIFNTMSIFIDSIIEAFETGNIDAFSDVNLIYEL